MDEGESNGVLIAIVGIALWTYKDVKWEVDRDCSDSFVNT